MLRKGDFLLTYNRFDLFGWLIKWKTKSTWSHATWILDNKYLLEAKSTGIKKNPISKYLAFNKKWIYNYKIFRLKGDKTKQIKRAMAYALTLQHNHNYFKFIWSLILIGFKKHTKCSHMSCSGFIAHSLALESIKFHSIKDPIYITPGDIARSKEVKDVTAKEIRY